MKRAILLLTTACILAGRHAPAHAQGQIVLDVTNLAQMGVDFALQKLQRGIVDQARLQAFDHFRQVTQHIGVEVFRAGSARAALNIYPAVPSATDYEHIYARSYAPGVPEEEQNRAARAQMEETVFTTAREIEQIRADIALLEGQITTLNEILAEVLSRPAASADASTRQGDIEQMQAALTAKTEKMAALRARVITIQAQHEVRRGLHTTQQTARTTAQVLRGAREYAPSALTTPFIPEPQYDGVRNFLRFPGLSEN